LTFDAKIGILIGVDENRIKNMADTGGRRNEDPLTDEQKRQVVDYAVSLGMSEENIVFSETAITGYIGGIVDMLRVGTDVLPLASKSKYPNDNITLRGVIAHEIVGHRGADLKGRSFQKREERYLDEAQASIRAAKFAPGLSDKERIVLLRDGIMRLKDVGKTLREVRALLYIDER
jgi:hypothetical protein